MLRELFIAASLLICALSADVTWQKASIPFPGLGFGFESFTVRAVGTTQSVPLAAPAENLDFSFYVRSASMFPPTTGEGAIALYVMCSDERSVSQIRSNAIAGPVLGGDSKDLSLNGSELCPGSSMYFHFLPVAVLDDGTMVPHVSAVAQPVILSYIVDHDSPLSSITGPLIGALGFNDVEAREPLVVFPGACILYLIFFPPLCFALTLVLVPLHIILWRRQTNKIQRKPIAPAGVYALYIFLGLFGVHRFRLGMWVSGIFHLLTLGIFGLGFVVDGFMLPLLVDMRNVKLSDAE